MQLLKNSKPIVIYLLIFVVGCFLAPNIYVLWGSHDRNCWITWSNYINYFGLQNVYKFGVDYPPLWHYFLWTFAKMNPTPEMIYLNIYRLKHLVLFIEIIGIFAVYKILALKKIKYAIFLPLLILFNIAFWYNNFLFGQIDGVHTAMAFISMALGLYKKPMLSLVFFVLCLNIKFQGIIFLPLTFIIIFEEIQKYSIWQIFKTLTPAILIQLIILIPYILSGDLKLAIDSCIGSVGRYPLVSMGAYNIWSLMFDNPQVVNDRMGIFGFSYHSYGLMAFFGLSGLILLPFALKSINLFTKYLNVKINLENSLLVSVLIILFFFYFNTQMHARYSHPVMLFAGTLAILRKDYVRFFLVSLAVFLNMEGTSKILKGNILDFKIIFFQPWFVSLIFLTVIILYSYDYVVLIKNSLKLKS